MPAVSKRIECVKCNVRIPKNRPILTCSLCNNTKHYKCNYLSKKDAEYIIKNCDDWICYPCILDTLPINACKNPSKNAKRPNNVITNTRIKCSSCGGQSHNSNNTAYCNWCEQICHKKCIKQSLGCKRCCEDIIPGFNYFSYEIIDTLVPDNSTIFDPYNRNHNYNQLGEKFETLDEVAGWSEFSDRLINCKYTRLKDVQTTKDGELKVMSLNIRSLTKNVDKINENIHDFQKFDVICLNETNCDIGKLPNGINDILLQGFNPPIIKAPARKSCKGGGLAIYTRESIFNADEIEKIELRNVDETTFDGEFLFIKLKYHKNSNKSIIIGNTYRSPSSKPEKYIEMLENVLSSLARHKNKQVLLMGDFNLDLIAYEKNTHCQNLIDTMSNHNLVQTISRPTRITDHSSTLIDHLYVNSLNNISKSGIVTLDLSDHLGTYINIVLNNKFDRVKLKGVNKNSEFQKYNAENNEKFRKLIADEEWFSVLQENDCQLKYDKFCEIYTTHYNTAYPKTKPTRRKKQRANPKPWILGWLEEACDRKNRLYHDFIICPTTANKTKYTKMKKFVEKHIKKSKNKYYTDYFEQYKNDSKKQWQMINCLLHRNSKKSSVTKIIDKDGNETNSPTEIAEKFNEYFVNIASELKFGNSHNFQHTNHESFLKNRTSSSIYLRPVEPDEVDGIIRGLKNKSTSDTKVSVLKIANEVTKFKSVITDVINSSFEQGVFPQQLKMAKVIPVHKSGSKTEISNYRPISLLSSFSKIFEKTMHNRITNFMESNQSLYEMQYGFRKGRSCEHALLTAQSAILNSLNRKEIALLLLIDFSKAFDMVEHGILLNKLDHYGIRGIAHDWLKSYLSNRDQFVNINGTNSTKKSLKFGVPQGSILGPLLFIIYINDIPEINRLVKFILYADDANIIITGKTIQEINQQFNELSKTLVNWVGNNGLLLNIKKTKYMIFSKHKIDTSLFVPQILDRPIERETTTKFLGVLVDDKLNWSQHICALRSNMARYIGIMYKLKSFLPLTARLNIFHSFVQSHINYCSLVWGFAAKANIDKIFATQKKAIRAVMPGFVNYFYKDGILPKHTKPAFRDLNILTVQSIIVKNAVVLMHKINCYPSSLPVSVRSLISNDAPLHNSTHETCANWLDNHCTSLYTKSFVYKGPLLYADLSGDINRPLFSTIITYKKYVKKHLIKLQGDGDSEEWESENFKLHNIVGLRKSNRIAQQENVHKIN